MDESSLRIIAALVLLVLFSAYFSASETAFTSLNRMRIKAWANAGNQKAENLLRFVEKYDRILSTILIGNNIVNILAASLGTVLFTRLSPHNGVLLSTIIITLAVLIFGEISPKTLARQAPEKFALLSLPFLKLLVALFLPLNYLFGLWQTLISKLFKLESPSGNTEAELITIVDEAEKGGDIGALEGDLIRSAIEFNDLDVEDVLTPRVDIVAIPQTATMEETELTFVSNSFSRLPVYDHSIDNVIGVIHEKDFLAHKHEGGADILPIIKNIVYASPTMKISTLLRLLQKSKSHLAIVIDEFGGTEGLVTLEDILEELVGEIWDEHDEVVETINKIDDNTYIVSGNANLEDLFELLEIHENSWESDAVTVGGWIIEQLDKFPQAGENFLFQNIRVTVLKADERRVAEAKLDLLPEEQEKDA